MPSIYLTLRGLVLIYSFRRYWCQGAQGCSQSSGLWSQEGGGQENDCWSWQGGQGCHLIFWLFRSHECKDRLKGPKRGNSEGFQAVWWRSNWEDLPKKSPKGGSWVGRGDDWRVTAGDDRWSRPRRRRRDKLGVVYQNNEKDQPVWLIDGIYDLKILDYGFEGWRNSWLAAVFVLSWCRKRAGMAKRHFTACNHE